MSEQNMQAAMMMREAAEKSQRAAEQITEAVQRLALMLEDGYGGNALKLIELLEGREA